MAKITLLTIVLLSLFLASTQAKAQIFGEPYTYYSVDVDTFRYPDVPADFLNTIGAAFIGTGCLVFRFHHDFVYDWIADDHPTPGVLNTYAVYHNESSGSYHNIFGPRNEYEFISDNYAYDEDIQWDEDSTYVVRRIVSGWTNIWTYYPDPNEDPRVMLPPGKNILRFGVVTGVRGPHD